jgi:AP2-like factor (euAP2 lineage)
MTIIRTFTQRKNTSDYLGVGLHRSGKWQTRITFNGKQVVLGLFDSEEDAAREYNNAAVRLLGVFATVNILKSEPRKEYRNAS